MPARKRLNIAEQIREMEQLNQQASEAQVEAVLKDPATAAVKLSALLEEWQKKGPSDFLRDDPEYQQFVKDISRQLTSDFFLTMRVAITLLGEKLQTTGEFIMPRDLSAIIGELGRQIKTLQEIAPEANAPIEKDMKELDKKIAVLEAELQHEHHSRPLDS